jgi:glycosyltransferase involved in cell wall biosynthesis
LTRLAILASHPIQYHGPLFRELAKRVDLHVFFAHKATPQQQASAGFGTEFEWDVDLTSGYAHSFLSNVARTPGTGHFSGCDTPDIGGKLRAGGFDALLVMGWHLKSFLQGLFAARRIGLPVLIRGDSHLETPRSDIKRLGKALIYPTFLRQFRIALYVGERSRAYYRHYGYPDEQLVFSPHCVDNEWFAARATQEARAGLRTKLGVLPETRIVLFAGKLVPFKRPRDVVDAVANCRAQGLGVEVMLAGDGELRLTLAEAAHSMGVPLHALGFCNQSEMPSAYAAADCLVLPSDGRETWGLVANEALASGCPIIVSQSCGCAPDLAIDGVAGRAFVTGDIEQLGNHMTAVFASPPSQSAIATISQRHSLSAAADGIQVAIEMCTLRQNAKMMAG